MQPWKTLSRRTILNQGQYLIVENHTIELPDGHVITDWPWLITPDYVNVVATTDEDEFLCFRQTKYAVDGTSLAPVGGYLEPGEEPLTAARRELLEETGYQASEWIDLGQADAKPVMWADTSWLGRICSPMVLGASNLYMGRTGWGMTRLGREQ